MVSVSKQLLIVVLRFKFRKLWLCDPARPFVESVCMCVCFIRGGHAFPGISLAVGAQLWNLCRVSQKTSEVRRTN